MSPTATVPYVLATAWCVMLGFTVVPVQPASVSAPTSKSAVALCLLQSCIGVPSYGCGFQTATGILIPNCPMDKLKTQAVLNASHTESKKIPRRGSGVALVTNTFAPRVGHYWLHGPAKSRTEPA